MNVILDNSEAVNNLFNDSDSENDLLGYASESNDEDYEPPVRRRRESSPESESDHDLPPHENIRPRARGRAVRRGRGARRGRGVRAVRGNYNNNIQIVYNPTDFIWTDNKGFEWTAQPRQTPNITFTGRDNPAADRPNHHATPADPNDPSPLQWFMLFVDDDLIQHMVTETNRLVR